MKARVSLLCLSLMCLGQMCGAPTPRPSSSPIAEGTYVGAMHMTVTSMINTDIYEETSSTESLTVLFGPRGLLLNDYNQEIAVGDSSELSWGGMSLQSTVTSIVTNVNSLVVQYDVTMYAPEDFEGLVFQGPAVDTFTVTDSRTLRYHSIINLGTFADSTSWSIRLEANGTLSRL